MANPHADLGALTEKVKVALAESCVPAAGPRTSPM